MALTNVGKSQLKKTKDNTSSVEILAVLIIGGASVYGALLGLYLDNPFLFWGGLIMLIMSVYITARKATKVTSEVVYVIRNFRSRLRERRKHKLS